MCPRHADAMLCSCLMNMAYVPLWQQKHSSKPKHGAGAVHSLECIGPQAIAQGHTPGSQTLVSESVGFMGWQLHVSRVWNHVTQDDIHELMATYLSKEGG